MIPVDVGAPWGKVALNASTPNTFSTVCGGMDEEAKHKLNSVAFVFLVAGWLIHPKWMNEIVPILAEHELQLFS